jgi:hypothetical protein
LKNWLIQWRIPLLLALGNVLLFYCFVHLISGNTKSGGGGRGHGRGNSADDPE